MWFNILKNAARDRAYQSFIRSFILYDRVSVRPEHIESVKEGDEVKVRWYTPNKAWYWEFFIKNRHDVFDAVLGTTITEHEPYTYFAENAMREEYPENWRVFINLFRENRDTIREKLYEEDEDGEVSGPFSKRVIRRLIEDFTVFKIELVNSILDDLTLGPRQRRALATDIGGPTTRIRYNEVRKKMNELENRMTGTYLDNIAEIFRIMQQIYTRAIRKNNPNIVWENFVNLCVEFRVDYLQLIRYNNPNPDAPLYSKTRLSIEEVENTIMGLSTEQIRTICRNVITSRSDELENLIDNLPDYD